MSTYLLDANVLIALTVVEHEHHERVTRWAIGLESFALCPITEGALLRYLLRVGEGLASACAVLSAIRAIPAGEFWPDSISYAEVPLDHVRGHRQLTDAYLAGLVVAHPDAMLATLDEGLASAVPSCALLVPPEPGPTLRPR